MTSFMIFEITKLVVGYCEGTLRSSKKEILRPNATAQILIVSKTLLFSKWSKHLDIKMSQNLTFSFL